MHREAQRRKTSQNSRRSSTRGGAADFDLNWAHHAPNQCYDLFRCLGLQAQVDGQSGSFDYFRPTEVDQVLGDPTKAREKLGRQHRTEFAEWVAEMVQADLDAVKLKEQCGNWHE